MYLYVSNIWTRINSLASRLPWCVCFFRGAVRQNQTPLFTSSNICTWFISRKLRLPPPAQHCRQTVHNGISNVFLIYIYINTYNAVHKIKYRNSTRNVMRAIFIQPKPLLMCQWENARCDDETEIETKTERKRACSCTLTYIEHAFEYWFHRI